MKSIYTLPAVILIVIYSLQSQAQSGSRVIKEYQRISASPSDHSYAASYAYSGDRGDTFYSINNHDFSFDNSLAHDTSSTHITNTAQLKNYDAHNNVTQSVTADDLSAMDSTENRSVYDANNNLISITYLDAHLTSPVMLTPAVHDSFAYDAHNNRTYGLIQQWNPASSTWVNYVEYFYQYDAANNKIYDSSLSWNTSTWQTSFVTIYTYTSGLITSTLYKGWDGSAVINNELVSDTYNSSHLLVSQNKQGWDNVSGTWFNESLDSTFYDAGNNISLILNYTATTPPAPAGYTLYQRTAFTYDAGHHILSEYDNRLPGSTTSGVISNFHFTYNSHGQPLVEQDTTWQVAPGGGPATLNGIQYHEYVYESYFTANVPPVCSGTDNLSIYPVPAQGLLNIDMDVNGAKDLTIAVYDVQGRLQLQYGAFANGHLQKTLSLSNLNNGNYILTIKGEGIATSRQFSVIH